VIVTGTTWHAVLSSAVLLLGSVVRADARVAQPVTCIPPVSRAGSGGHCCR